MKPSQNGIGSKAMKEVLKVVESEYKAWTHPFVELQIKVRKNEVDDWDRFEVERMRVASRLCALDDLLEGFEEAGLIASAQDLMDEWNFRVSSQIPDAR